MATALAYALKSRFDNVERFGDAATGQPAASGAPAQPVPAEKKDEQARMIGRMALFDLLMGTLMVFVAWGYNSAEQRFAVKVATCVFAFFFWHLYGLYFLIRAGALKEPLAMGSPAEIVNMVRGAVKRAKDVSKEMYDQTTGLRSGQTKFVGGDFF